jgi:ankyrin repeat protein
LQSSHVEVVKLLLRRDADINTHNNNDQTAATLASANNKANVASILADYKADPTGQNTLCSITLEAA